MSLRWVRLNYQFKLKMAQVVKVFHTQFYINVYSQDRNREIFSLPMQKAYLLGQIKRPCASTNPCQVWHLIDRRLKHILLFLSSLMPHHSCILLYSLFLFEKKTQDIHASTIVFYILLTTTCNGNKHVVSL